MAKQLLKKELIYINFNLHNQKKDKVESKFYYIEMLSIGYNQIQVIATSGKGDNEGRQSVKRFDGEEAFKEARKFFYDKFFEKKSKGYEERQDLGKWLQAFHPKSFEKNLELIQTETISAKKKGYKHNPSKKSPSTHQTSVHCDLCQKTIKNDIYSKINEWARGEGNWDSNASFIGFQKVLCIDCQIEHDIFKKKV